MSGKSPAKKKKSKQAAIVKKNQGDKLAENRSLKIKGKTIQVDLIIYLAMFATVILLLLVGPFNRGIFFPRDLLVSQIVVFSLLAVWGIFRLLKRDKRLIETPLDICLLVLLAAYFVSLFFAVHKRDALEELLKIGMYLVVYLVAIDLSRYWKSYFPRLSFDGIKNGDETPVPAGPIIILNALSIIAFIITIASLGAAAGHWTFAGAYASNRIASPMGYANTAAAYLMAAYLLTLALATLAGRRFRLLYLAPAAVMLLTVILTFSRGAWLLLPPLALLLVIASAPGERLRALLYLAATALAAVPAALLADPVFRSASPPMAWLYILAAALLAYLFGWLVELYLARSQKMKKIIAGAFAGLFAVIVFIFIIMPSLGPVHLEQPADSPARLQAVRQVVENIEAGREYELVLEVNAEGSDYADSDEAGYFWGVRVLGGLPGYRDETLLNYLGSETDGWQEKSLSFQTVGETTRLEVQIYNNFPGSSVKARSVALVTPDKTQRLTFAYNRILPQRFYDRIFSYSRDRNLDRRLELFSDAGKIIRDYPLTGTGGGGWATLYHSYQDQSYSSREIHNHYLQVWVEAGLFGFIAFIGIWISFAIAFIRNCGKGKASPRRWQLWTASFLPAAALGAHSAIDWNFSMAAVGFYLFVLLGVGRSLDRISWFSRSTQEEGSSVSDDRSRGVIVGVLGLIFGLSLLVYSSVLLTGHDATWRSQELMERGNIKQAMIEMERGIRLDPYRTDNYHNLAVYLEDQARRTGSTAEIQQALALAEKAYQLEPYNPTYVIRYGDMLLNYVGIEEGLYYIDQIIDLRPHSAESYIQPSWARLRLMEFFVESGNTQEAEQYYIEIIAFRDMMEENHGDSSALAYIVGRANYLVGNIPLAISYYRLVADDDQFFDEAQQRLAEILSSDGTSAEDNEGEIDSEAENEEEGGDE